MLIYENGTLLLIVYHFHLPQNRIFEIIIQTQVAYIIILLESKFLFIMY